MSAKPTILRRGEMMDGFVKELRQEVRKAVREGLNEAFGDLDELRSDLEFLRQWRKRWDAFDQGFWGTAGRMVLLATLIGLFILISLKGGTK